MAFQCVIVTPEAQSLDQQVKQVIVPAHDGLLGILTGRAPILVKLGLGALTVDTVDNKRLVFFVDGGVAQVKDDVLTIATTEATPVTQLDSAQAAKELAEATAARVGENIPAELRERSIRRAKKKLELAK
ncbi:MAG: ATP synthase F1 subunit epsilon [Burkholderiales bacterium]|nr:ATP synthase F1 subunit epsilon [Phycisphaerae bacterium]